MEFNDVTKFVKDMVKVGGIYDVDTDGYVANKLGNDQPVLVKDGTQFKRLLVIKEIISDNDAIIINPLHEDTTESIDSRWTFISLSSGLARRLIELVRFVRLSMTISEDVHAPAEIVKLASRHTDFDDKALKNFELISKNMIEFANVHYVRKLKEARFRCVLFDPDGKAQFPNISDKSWKIMRSLMADIFGIDPDKDDDISKYNVSSDLITIPKLESVLSVYLKIYTQINKYMVALDNDDSDLVVDITTLGAHIMHLPEYYEKCKWFNGRVIDKVTMKQAVQQTQDNIPTNVAIPTPCVGQSGIPDNPVKHGMSMQFGGMQPTSYANSSPMQPQFGQPMPQFGQYQPQFGQPMPQQYGFIQPQNQGCMIPI